MSVAPAGYRRNAPTDSLEGRSDTANCHSSCTCGRTHPTSRYAQASSVAAFGVGCQKRTESLLIIGTPAAHLVVASVSSQSVAASEPDLFPGWVVFLS